MTEQLFTVVGITVHGNDAKIRFTDDMCRRVKQFSKGKASRIDFIDLPNKMTKIEALKYMLTCKEFSSAEDQATIKDTLEDKEREARKNMKTVSVKSAVSLDAIKNRPRKDVSVSDILEAVQ